MVLTLNPKRLFHEAGSRLFCCRHLSTGGNMPLINFGSILNFAEQLETQDGDFYTAAAANRFCAGFRELFDQFAKDAAKNVKNIQRTRRENVTEMILEQIRDFTRDAFIESSQGADTMDAAQVLETALRLEERAQRYYREAAQKLKALSEVARTLEMVGKKHRAHFLKLQEL